MNIKIKTKDFLQIINKNDIEIKYENGFYKIDFKLLQKLINLPSENEIFKKTDDVKLNLHKNMALYIINDDEIDKLINVDFEKKQIISGYFELFKNIYNKSDFLFISINENDTNKEIFGKIKTIKYLDKIENAQDIFLNNLENLFTTEKPNEKIDLENQIYWDSIGPDKYANIEFIMMKLKQIMKDKEGFIYKTDGYTNELVRDLRELFLKVDVNVLSSEKFHKEIYDLKENERNFIFNSFARKYSELNDKFKFSFLENVVTEKILNEIEKNNISLLSFFWNNIGNVLNQEIKDKLSVIVNDGRFVEYLKKNVYAHDYLNRDKVSILNLYCFLNDENKRNEDIVNTYIKSCYSKDSSRESYLQQRHLFNLPFDILNNEKYLKIVLKQIDISLFFDVFKMQPKEKIIFANKDFLLENVGNINASGIVEILNKCYDKKEINKKFILDIIDKNPFFLKKISESVHSGFFEFANDLDVIYLAYKRGLKIEDISKIIMTNKLVEISENEEIEKFKLLYILSHNDLFNIEFNDKEKQKIFKEKYLRPDIYFLNLKADHQYNYRKQKTNSIGLKTIKDPQKIYDLLNQIDLKTKSLNVMFNINDFYLNINEELKNNIELIKNVKNRYGLKFDLLPDRLKFNKNMILFFLEKDENIINKIPNEFFNDVNFALNFVKLIDDGKININKCPLFINKFFENHDIKSDFYNNLKKYVNLKKLTQKLDNDNHVEQEIIKKKNKI